MSNEDLNDEFLKVRLYNRFGSFLNQIRELTMKGPVDFLRIYGNYDWPRPCVFVLCVAISESDKLWLWPFQKLRSDSYLSYLGRALDTLVTSCSRRPVAEEEHFKETRCALIKCKEQILLESAAPGPPPAAPESTYEIMHYTLDYCTRENETIRASCLSSIYLIDESETRENPEELHYTCLARAVDDILAFIDNFDYTNFERNEAFIQKYHNVIYIIKILELLRIMQLEENSEVDFEGLFEGSVANVNQREELSPSELYQIFREMNRE